MPSRLLKEIQDRMKTPWKAGDLVWPTIQEELVENLSKSFPDLCPPCRIDMSAESLALRVAIQQGERNVMNLLRNVRYNQINLSQED